MTNTWQDIRNANVVIVMGGNAAEAHPCGFKWVIEAKIENHAKLVVIDPRFTRTASVADVYAPFAVMDGGPGDGAGAPPTAAPTGKPARRVQK